MVTSSKSGALGACQSWLLVAACVSVCGCAAGDSTPGFFIDDPGGSGEAGARDASSSGGGGGGADATGPTPAAEDAAPSPDGRATASCVGRCASTSGSGGCFCDPGCGVHNDCCGDYASVCSAADAGPPPVTTCASRCGAPASSTACACDTSCKANGNCCGDYASTCGAPDAGTPHAGSCLAQCGVRGPAGQCHCDSACQTYGDCCTDYTTLCGDGG